MSEGVLNERFEQFLERRIPPSSSITLSQSNVFIFPTKTGFVFGFFIALLIIGAINYQASLVFGLAFLLGAMLMVTILYTFRNLSGLRLELAESRPGFVGEDVQFSVRVVRPSGRGREGVQLGWPGSIRQWAELADKEADVVRLYVRGSHRGWLDPGRLLIETYYPLGLLRAWTWVDLNARALVYPKPIFENLPRFTSGRRDEGVLVDPLGSDDFTDIKAYTRGDPIKHVIWRSYARSDGRDLQVKRFTSYQEPRLWLRFDDVQGDTEARLQRLTGMALRATREDREFGLELPAMNVRLQPGIGEAHLETVLRELALYGR